MAKMDQNFFEKVYQVVRQIPAGRVSSYGAIARFIGSPQSARMVGWAMNASHNREDVPAHRVVNRKGVLTGKHFFGGSTLMEDLLKSEGILVVEDQIQNFEQCICDPMEYLNQEEYFTDLL